MRKQVHRRADGSIVREANKTPVAEVAARKSAARRCTWKRKFGGMAVYDAKRLKSQSAGAQDYLRAHFARSMCAGLGAMH